MHNKPEIPVEKRIVPDDGDFIVFPIIDTRSPYLEVEEIQALKEKIKGLPYKEKLRELFYCSGELRITTVIEPPVSEHPDGYPIYLLNPEFRIDLTPNKEKVDSTAHEIWIYNELVRECLTGMMDKPFVTAEQLISKFQEQVERAADNRVNLAVKEKQRIEGYFLKAYNTTSVKINFRGGVSNNSFGKIDNSKLFYYLFNGFIIDYSEYIHWENHLDILNIQEKVKYMGFILEIIKEAERLKITPEILKDKNYVRNLKIIGLIAERGVPYSLFGANKDTNAGSIKFNMGYGVSEEMVKKIIKNYKEKTHPDNRPKDVKVADVYNKLHSIGIYKEYIKEDYLKEYDNLVPRQ